MSRTSLALPHGGDVAPDEAGVIRRKVENALRRFLDAEEYLLGAGVHERTVAHRLAGYLAEEFEGWDVEGNHG